MNNQQALNLVEQAVLAYRGTFQEHQSLQVALGVIRKALEPKEEKKEDKK